MVLTLRFDKDQEKLINKLKKIYSEKSATKAILKAIKYVANEYENDEIKIDNLQAKIELLESREAQVKSLINQVNRGYSKLLEYSDYKESDI